MLILFLLALIMAVCGLASPKYGLRQNNYKNYMLIFGVLIALVMGLRSRFHTGSSDTWAYTLAFDRLRNYNNFWDYYDFRLSDADFFFSEWGFYYCTWLLGRVFDDGQILIFVSSVFITLSTCLFIRKNSTDGAMALLMYVCLGLFTFNMNGMRQGVAMSICLFAVERAKKGQLLRFLLIVALAVQFHKSAMVFLPVFFLPRLKSNQGNYFVFAIFMIIFILFCDRLIPLVNDATGKEYSGNNAADGGGIVVVMLYLSGILLAMICPNALEKPAAQMAFFGTIMGLTAYLTRYIYQDIMERMSYYYFYFLVLLIPETISELSEEEKNVVKILLVVFSILLFVYRISKSNFRNFTFYFLD